MSTKPITKDERERLRRLWAGGASGHAEARRLYRRDSADLVPAYERALQIAEEALQEVRDSLAENAARAEGWRMSELEALLDSHATRCGDALRQLGALPEGREEGSHE